MGLSLLQLSVSKGWRGWRWRGAAPLLSWSYISRSLRSSFHGRSSGGGGGGGEILLLFCAASSAKVLRAGFRSGRRIGIDWKALSSLAEVCVLLWCWGGGGARDGTHSSLDSVVGPRCSSALLAPAAAGRGICWPLPPPFTTPLHPPPLSPPPLKLFLIHPPSS